VEDTLEVDDCELVGSTEGLLLGQPSTFIVPSGLKIPRIIIISSPLLSTRGVTKIICLFLNIKYCCFLIICSGEHTNTEPISIPETPIRIYLGSVDFIASSINSQPYPSPAIPISNPADTR
jgi:hypothetical protein